MKLKFFRELNFLLNLELNIILKSSVKNEGGIQEIKIKTQMKKCEEQIEENEEKIV